MGRQFSQICAQRGDRARVVAGRREQLGPHEAQRPAAHRIRPQAATLQDLPGGWDVSLGNVVLEGVTPTCTAHGALVDTAGVWRCTECGAQAILG